MSQGHPDARFYPLSMLWEEAIIVVERMNQSSASDAALLQIAGSAVMSKKGLDLLQKTIKGLLNG